MAIPVQKFREIVFQLLYSYDLSAADAEDMIPLIMKELAVTRKTVVSAQERAMSISNVRSEIDKMISSTSASYAFERIQSVERNILRLGVYELFFDSSVPPKVAISEAMRLARKFASPESASFVNAILDALYKASLGEPVQLDQLKEASQGLEAFQKLAEQASQEMPLIKEEEDDEEQT